MARNIAITALIVATSLATEAQQPTHIVEQIQADGIITVEMPKGVYERLLPVEPVHESTEATTVTTPAVGRMAGYRVQAFSGNSDSAKSEGLTREAKVRSLFPEVGTYLVYNAPYWRLRVGDFRTRAEAEEFATTIKKAFPAFRREITVVRDRINVTQ